MELSKRTIQKAIAAGFVVVVVDGGSSEQLTEEYKLLGAVVSASKELGMGKQRREAIKIADSLSDNVVIWMEPEKESFIDQISHTTQLLIAGEAEMVIPKRSELESYPSFQRLSEQLGNLFWKEVTCSDLDIYFGPRAWTKDLTRYFLEYDGEFGDTYDSINIPVMNALHDDKKVVSVEVDYAHPLEQTQEEEGSVEFNRKRLKQLEVISNFIDIYWNRLSVE